MALVRYSLFNPNFNYTEFGTIWKRYRMEFKPLEFEGFRRQAGLNAFVLSPQKWIEATEGTI